MPEILKTFFKVKISRRMYLGLGIVLFSFILVVVFVRSDFSFFSRWEYLKVAWKLWLDNPVWGYGPATYGTVAPQYVAHSHGYSQYVHNSYVQIWLENGVFGFAALLGLVWIFFKQALNAYYREERMDKKVLGLALIWSMAAFLADNLTSFSIFIQEISIFAWALLAGAGVLWPLKSKVRVIRSGFQKILLAAAIITIGIFLFLSGRMALGLWFYDQGARAAETKELSQALSYFHTSRAIDPANPWSAAAEGSIYIEQYKLNRQKEYLAQAEHAFLQSVAMEPYSYESYFLLGKIALAQGDPKKSQEYLDKAVKIFPYKFLR
jgi:tetratricopeptide (TPR) repeat protein